MISVTIVTLDHPQAFQTEPNLVRAVSNFQTAFNRLVSAPRLDVRPRSPVLFCSVRVFSVLFVWSDSVVCVWTASSVGEHLCRHRHRGATRGRGGFPPHARSHARAMGQPAQRLLPLHPRHLPSRHRSLLDTLLPLPHSLGIIVIVIIATNHGHNPSSSPLFAHDPHRARPLAPAAAAGAAVLLHPTTRVHPTQRRAAPASAVGPRGLRERAGRRQAGRGGPTSIARVCRPLPNAHILCMPHATRANARACCAHDCAESEETASARWRKRRRRWRI